DFAMQDNLLKVLTLVTSLEVVLTVEEAQAIRTIVQRHIIDFATELGDAPAGLTLKLEMPADVKARSLAEDEEKRKVQVERDKQQQAEKKRKEEETQQAQEAER